MKKAFTMMELIFVIVVIGILAAVVIPRTGSNKLNEAAIQVVSHIRYTQHLAMVDDKFNEGPTNPDKWYKKRWQIFFASTVGSGEAWAYSIFSDSAGDSTGTPDVSELAINPLDGSKYLTGGYSAGTVAFGDSDATRELNIGKKYGITDVEFSTNCAGDRIAFDYLGRPIYGNSRYLSDAFTNSGSSRLIQYDGNGDPCIVTITSDEGSLDIAIEPETGYAHIL